MDSDSIFLGIIASLIFLAGISIGFKIGHGEGAANGAKMHFKGKIVCVEIVELNKIECGEPK